MTCLPKRIPITKTFAPNTDVLNVTWSKYASADCGTTSAGILLTALIMRLTNVTAKATTIKEFSEASSIGFLLASSILEKPDRMQASAMFALLSPLIRIMLDVRITFRAISTNSQYHVLMLWFLNKNLNPSTTSRVECRQLMFWGCYAVSKE